MINGLAARLGVSHRGFDMSPRELIDATLQASGWGTLAEVEEKNWLDVQPDFARSHYIEGFAWPDKKFRFKADWPRVPFKTYAPRGPYHEMPSLPDHWRVIEEANAEHPFRLETSPARNFLNSSFTEGPTGRRREGRPEVMIHPDDAAEQGISNGAVVTLGNERGRVRLHARLFDGVQRGVAISEGIWPNDAFMDGQGINVLTGDDSPAPFGGDPVHDNRVWVRKV